MTLASPTFSALKSRRAAQAAPLPMDDAMPPTSLFAPGERKSVRARAGLAGVVRSDAVHAQLQAAAAGVALAAVQGWIQRQRD